MAGHQDWAGQVANNQRRKELCTDRIKARTMARNENANAPVTLRYEDVTDRGACCNRLEGNASKSETSLDYKRGFLEVKASTLLSYALHADTPLGAALVSGSQLIFILRQNGITADHLEFSIAREAV
jgi:hypothetical protein